MTISATIQHTASLPGVSIQSTITRTATGGLQPQNIALPAAKAGTLSTRTSTTAGILTLSSGHGIEVDDVVDVYWVDALGADQVCFGAVVSSKDATTVTFSLGNGVVLPVETYAITVGVVQALDVDFDADLVEILVAMNTKVGHIVFEEVDDTVLDYSVLPQLEPYSYIKDLDANPLSIGTINLVDQLQVSNGGVVASVFKFGGLYNSDE